MGVTGALVQTPAPGSAFRVGTVPVAFTAQDAAGNTGTLAFVVNFNDGTLPIIVTVPQDRTLPAGSAGTGVAPDLTGELTATDNVGVTAISQSPAAGSVLPLGATDVTLTASDAAGNRAQAIVHLTVPTAPPR